MRSHLGLHCLSMNEFTVSYQERVTDGKQKLDPDKIPNDAASHLDLYCLPMLGDREDRVLIGQAIRHQS